MALILYQVFCYLQHPFAEGLLVLGQIDVVASVATSSDIGVHSACGLQRKHYFKTAKKPHLVSILLLKLDVLIFK